MRCDQLLKYRVFLLNDSYLYKPQLNFSIQPHADDTRSKATFLRIVDLQSQGCARAAATVELIKALINIKGMINEVIRQRVG